MAATVRKIKLRSGVQMPIVGLGTWKSKPGEVEAAVKAAIDTGYRHIDCAWIYGNEAEVGAAIKDKLQEGAVNRDQLFVVSKLWNTKHGTEDAKKNLQQSLTNLGLDYLDLWLIHWPMAFAPGLEERFPRDEDGNIIYSDIHFMDSWKAMEWAVDEGLVKSIGLSNFNSQQIQEVLDKSRIKPDVLQVEIHPYFSQEKLVNFCHDRGIAVTAYSPLGSPDRPWAAPGEPLLLEDPKIQEVAKKYNKTPAQVILRWLTQRDIIVIPKSVTPSRITENFNILDFELSSEDMAVVSGFNRDCRIVAPYVTRDGKREFRDKAAPNFPFLAEY